MKKLLVMMAVIIGALTFSNTAKAQVVTVEEEVTYNYEEAYKLLDLINEYIKETNPRLPMLQADQNMMKIAMHRAGECGYYDSHIGPDGTRYQAMENIAYYSAGETAVQALTQWKNSSDHNRTMLGGYPYCGVGVVGNYAVVCFYTDMHQDGVIFDASNTTRLPNQTLVDTFRVDTKYLEGKTYTVREDGVYVVTDHNTDEEEPADTSVEKEDEKEKKEEKKVKNPSKVSSVKLSRVKKSKKRTEIKVSYKKVKGCKYQVQLSTDKKFKKSVKKITTGSTKKTYTKAYKGKRVYVRVRAYKTVKGKKYYGKWSSVKSIKTYK